MSVWRTFVLMIALAATSSVALGQEPAKPKGVGPDYQKKLRERKQRRFNVERQVEQMKTKLQLDSKQAAVIVDILVKQRAEVMEFRKSMRMPPELHERITSMASEMQEARKAGDHERVKELRAEQVKLGEEIQKSRRPLVEKTAELQEKTRTEIRKILRDDQKADFDAYWEQYMSGQRRGKRFDRSAKSLKRILDRVRSLSSTQRSKIEELFKTHREAARDSEGGNKKRSVKKLYDDVLAVLTKDQKAFVETRLEGRRARLGEHRRFRRQGRGGEKPKAPKKDDASGGG